MNATHPIAALALLLAACGPSSHAQTRVVSVRADQPSPSRDNFRARMLEMHNRARMETGLGPLAWKDTLAADAMSWARTIASDGKMRHSDRDTRPDQGENLWMGTADFFTLEHMIEVMVDEKKDFKSGIFPEVSRTKHWEDVAHYTQIIWPETREVGCALASANGRDALVCRYAPTGNVFGRPVG